MLFEEVPLLIPCEAYAMIGILHKPSMSSNTAILIVPAGGPQYRVGCARQIILWSRRLADEGYPVLRFDYRGFGDSAGEFQGFENIDSDIRSAVDCLKLELPELENIILWGECNAASALMMYAWQDERVKAMILQNPWVRNETTQARTYIKHYYLMRLMQKSFWLKLLKIQFNPFKAFSDLISLVRQAKNIQPIGSTNADFDMLGSFQEKMLEGVKRFNGKILLFMSGYSLIGKEFDELVSVSPSWKNALSDLDLTRIDEPDADHTFSRVEDREKLVNNVIQWLGNQWFK